MLTLGLLLAVAVQATRATPPPAPVAHTVSGIVLDEHGAPLAGALVQFRPSYFDRKPIAETTSHADGRFEFSVEPDSRLDRNFLRDLSVTFPGLAPTVIDQVPCFERDYDFGAVHVYPFAELHGRVTTVDGAPIAGALIYANASEPSTVATTGDDGTFACRNVPSGLVEFGVSAPGFADLDLGFRKLSLRSPNELNATLSSGRSVTLHVRSRKTGAPLVATGEVWIPRERKQLIEWDGSIGPDSCPSIHSLARGGYVGDAEGQLTVAGVALGSDPRLVLVSASGHQDIYVPLSEPEVTVHLEPTLVIDVQVRRQHAFVASEIARVALTLSRETATRVKCWTDAEQVGPGHWRVHWSGDSIFAPAMPVVGIAIELVDGAQGQAAIGQPDDNGEFAVVFDFPPTTRMTGRAVSTDGRPVQLRLGLAQFDPTSPHWAFGVRWGSFDPPLFQFDTGEDGRFVLDSVGLSRGRFEIVTPGWEFVDAPVEFVAGVDSDVERVLTARRVARTDVVVRGVVRVGEAAPGLPLQLGFGSSPVGIRDDWVFPTLTWTDAAGRFEVVLPSSGTYTIRAQNPKLPEASLRSLLTELLSLDPASPKSIEVTGPLQEGVQVDLPPFEKWTAEPLKHR